MFSALRLGSELYILNKTDVPKLDIGIVLNVSSMNYSPYGNGGIDVQVKVGEDVLDFKLLPGVLSIANYSNGSTIVSESKDSMVLEVENMIRNSKSIIESLPYHENVLESGENILRLLNPQFAKLKDLEEKINNLETKVGSMESKLDDIATMLNKALNK